VELSYDRMTVCLERTVSNIDFNTNFSNDNDNDSNDIARLKIGDKITRPQLGEFGSVKTVKVGWERQYVIQSDSDAYLAVRDGNKYRITGHCSMADSESCRVINGRYSQGVITPGYLDRLLEPGYSQKNVTQAIKAA